MNQVIPFNSSEFSVRAIEIAGETWFVGKDIATALGYTNPQKAVRDHCKAPHPIGVNESLTPSLDPQTVLVNEPDMFRLIIASKLPAAERFERWVFEEVLPSIRKTGSYTARKAPAPLKATTQAAKAFPAFFRAARLIGCDRNAAAIAANQAVMGLTDVNLLQQLGHTHLVAANQDTQYFTPTELGKHIGTSARGVNLLLAESGLQMKRGDVWEVTEAGREFARIYDTGKKHGSGVAITQIKWSPNVLPLLGDQKEAA
jgi:prophage antirepressor-like protein